MSSTSRLIWVVDAAGPGGEPFPGSVTSSSSSTLGERRMLERRLTVRKCPFEALTHGVQRHPRLSVPDVAKADLEVALSAQPRCVRVSTARRGWSLRRKLFRALSAYTSQSTGRI